MRFRSIVYAFAGSIMWFSSCNTANNANSDAPLQDTITNLKGDNMKSYISMFEIPAEDISRAIQFYQVLLDVEIEKMDVDGMQLGILPYEGQMISGVIVQAEGYKPSSDGIMIYLNAGEDLQVMLDRVEKNGGQILLPKTAHADGSGYFAQFIDSEGNRVALNSPH